jgi:glyoxylase I family protein
MRVFQNFLRGGSLIMELNAIHHIAIIVSDYAASRAFYVDKLGFPVLRENYRPEKRDRKLDLKVNNDTELEIFAPENPPKRPSYPEACGLRHLAFHVSDIDNKYSEALYVRTRILTCSLAFVLCTVFTLFNRYNTAQTLCIIIYIHNHAIHLRLCFVNYCVCRKKLFKSNEDNNH